MSLLFTHFGFAQSPPTGTIITSRSVATYTNGQDAFYPPLSIEVTTEVSEGAALNVSNSVFPTLARGGDTLTYTVIQANLGNSTADDVVLTTELSDETKFVSASGGGRYDEPTHTVTWPVSNLPASAFDSFTVEAQLKGDPQRVLSAEEIVSTAVVSNASQMDSDIALARLGEGADLSVIKSVDAEVTYPGGVLNYNITVANTGNEGGVDLRIDDTLTDGVALIEDSVNFPYTLNGRRLEILLGDIGSGSLVTASFAVQVSPIATDRQVILNKALALAQDTDFVLSNEVSSIVRTDLNLVLDGVSKPGAISPGDNITYTLFASNVGGTILTDMTVRHPLPLDTQFLTIRDGGSFIDGFAVWEIDALAPEENQQFSWEVRSNSNIEDNSVLHAPATVESSGTILASTDIITLILERAAVEVGFYSAEFTDERTVYFEGEDAAHLQVSDPLANQDDSVIETVVITVSSADADFSASELNASSARRGDTEELTLTETSTSSGLFRGNILFSLGNSIPGDGSLSVDSNTLLFASYVDSLQRVTSLQSDAIYNPSTTVFNSVTGEVVPFSAVQVLNEDGSPAQFVDGSDSIFITNFRGEVFIPELVIPDNQSLPLRVEVSPPPDSELSYPSTIPDENLPPELSSGKTTRFGEGSRGEVFVIERSIPTVAFDIPLDPGEGFLRVEKTSRNSEIAIGEIVTYEVTISNAGSTAVTDVRLIDQPPREFRYIEGSALREEASIYDTRVAGSSVEWALGRLNPGESVRLSYKMMVGVDATEGFYMNSAYATGTNFLENIESNVALYEIRVSEGVFSRNGTILGRVFVDLNNNGVLDPDEPGVIQTVVLMEDGSYVVTDNMGRFSFRNIKPGQHVLRLDSSSLPLEVEASGRSGRFLNRVDSQWLEMNASGLIKANFPVVPVSDSAREEILLATESQVQELSRIAPAQDISAPELTGLDARSAELEALVSSFDSNDFAFVNLEDGQQLSGVHADIQIKFPSGASIVLQLNGSPVDVGHLGTSVENPASNVILHEYVAIRLSENIENTISATLIDPFGNERGTQEIRLFTQSQAKTVEFQIDETVNPIADGVTLIPVTATVLNSLGNPAAQIEMISIDVRPARILEDDVDPANPGHQLRLIDGVAYFSVRAPRQPGQSIITVQVNDVRGEASIMFQPHLRGLMVVGSGDVVLGSGSTDGDVEQLDNIFGDKVQDGTTTDGHLAVFVNGAITEKTLLTATYDSAKERPNDFFFAREQQVDEESMPAITGDGSSVGYSGSSRDKLFLRLDRENSHAVWGDYRTSIGNDQLSAYNRTFTGFRSEILEENFRVTGFAAEMMQDQIVDAIPANGTSGYYFLSRGPLILGSERVVLETRDRLRPDVVLNSVSLVRNTDYDIDYYEGSILTRSPIPTYDEALNPNILIVTYEVENETNDQWAYGVRGEVDLFGGLILGATAVVEESAIDDYGLQGFDLSWHADSISTLFTAQYAQSQSVISEDGLLNSEDGGGIRFGLEGAPTQNIEYSAYYQDIEKFFVNPSAVDMRPGTKIFGADARYKLNEISSLNIAAFKEDDELNDNSFSHVAAGWQGQLSRFALGAEVYSDQFDSDRAAPSSLADDGKSANEAFDSATGRYPFDSTAEQVSQDLGVRLSGGTNLTEKIALTLSHAQDVRNTDQSLSYAKLNYNLSQDRSLYLIQRFDRYEDRDESRTLLGLETPIAYNTTSFVEYQMEDTANGNQIRQSIGLRNLFELGENFFGNASYEKLDTISGEAGANRPDGFASTVSTTYLPTDSWRLTARAEFRDETELVTKLGELGVATELSEDVTLLGRARYFTTEGDKSGAREDLRTTLGLAWRPTSHDRFQGLARLDWWKQDRQTETQTFVEDKLYGSVEGIYQVSDKLSVSAKYAGKQYELDSYSLYNDLYSVRATYLLNDRWELGATARVLNEHDFNNTLTGGAVDVGMRVWEFIWVTAGYSFDDFDSDLTGAGYSGEGFFLKFRFKFDENILSDF